VKNFKSNEGEPQFLNTGTQKVGEMFNFLKQTAFYSCWIQKKMRCCSIILFAPFLAMNLQSEPMHLATSEWAPYCHSGAERSVATQLVESALNEIHLKVDTTFVETGTLSTQVQSGKFAGSPAFWKDAERESYLLFSEPYLQNRLVLLATKENKVDYSDLNELHDVSLGLIAKFSYGVDPADFKGEIEFLRTKNFENALERLLSGELDYVLVDEMMFHYAKDELDEAIRAQLHASDDPILRRTLHFVLRKDFPDAQRIMARFNYQIKQMKMNGSYNQILDLDWIEVDINDDGVFELLYGGDSLEDLTPKNSFKLFNFDIATPITTDSEAA